MLTSVEEATQVFSTWFPNAVVEQCVEYKSDFLVRVKHPLPDEANYDPFFLVTQTGQIREFSVMTDGDPDEILAAFSVDN